jgi:ADP-ribose pyrophosphatase
MEETGFFAPRLDLLYTYAPAIGYSNERIHIFAAPDVQRQSDRTDEREIRSVDIVPLRDLLEEIRGGRILDGKTLIGLCMAGFLQGLEEKK